LITDDLKALGLKLALSGVLCFIQEQVWIGLDQAVISFGNSVKNKLFREGGGGEILSIGTGVVVAT
jgi:hypothetical protein